MDAKEMQKKSVESQRKKYGKKYGAEMRRRTLMRWEKKLKQKNG